MKSRVLAVFLLLILGTARVSAQFTPLDRCVRDSLYRVMPQSGLIQKGIIHLEIAELIYDTLPQQAFRNIQMALSIAVNTGNISLKGKARIAMGDYFNRRRNFMLAQEHFMAAGKIFKLGRDTVGELISLGKIGCLNRAMTNYDKALDYFERGLQLARTTKNHSQTGIFLNAMGVTRQYLRQYSETDRLYHEALAEFQKAGDIRNQVAVQNDIGGMYLGQGKYDQALTCYEDLLTKTDPSQHDLLAGIYTRIGHAWYMKNNYRKSLYFNKKALWARQQIGSSIEINSSLINVGGDFYLLNMADSGRFYLERGLRLAILYNRKNLSENAYRHLYRFYLRHGDFKQALTYYKRYTSDSTVIEKEKSSSNIAILETNQKILEIKESRKLLNTTHEIYTLSLTNQEYQLQIVEAFTILASLLLLVFTWQIFYTRRVRWDMQKLNVLLSDEIKEREATELQTSEREKQFRFLSENSVDFILYLDSQMQCTYSSPASMKVFGYNEEEILQLSPKLMVHADSVDYVKERYTEMMKTRNSQQLTYQALKKNGSSFWVESILNPLFDPITGDFKGLVGVTRDIQERKTKELEIMEGTKQKENLLKEIHHRVKNNFAILVSLINMQMAQTKNQELYQSLTNLQLRIRTMALVHEMLYRSKDFENISFSDYLRSLASVIAGTYNRRDINLVFEADESVMDIEASIPLGLIVNEILSNSYKHAFPGGRAGNIWLTFRVDHDNDTCCLILQDDGIGMPSDLPLEQYKSMGLQVIQILCQQIEGDLELTSDHGTTFTLTYKVPGK